MSGGFPHFLEELEEPLIFRQDSLWKRLSHVHPPDEARVKGRCWVPHRQCQASAAASMGGFQRCRQRHWSCLRRQTSLVTGICYSGRARGRGDRLQGAFVSPVGLSLPVLLSGFCIQRRMPGGLLLDPLEPQRMDFNYPILFVH